MKQIYFQLKIISMDVNIPRLAQFTADMCMPLSISEKKAMYLCFVVETVLEMRMKQLGPDNPYIEIEVAKDKDVIYVSVKDKGLPYVLTDNQRRMIGKGFVDGYRLEQLSAEGQRIVFRLRQDELAELEMPTVEREELLDCDITVRRTQPTEEDANEVVKCFYSAYGYNYMHQSMYRLDELRRMLTGGHYISLLAQNTHGQTLGHLALNEEEEMLPGLFEYCNLITKPFARGKGVARTLSNQVTETMHGLKQAQGSYMLGAAFHTATEKLSNIAGFTPTGFHFQYIPREITDKIYWKGEARLSCFYSAALTDKKRLHTLYIPEEIRPFTQKIFERENANYVFATEDGMPDENMISVDVDSHIRTVRIFADQCGSGFGSKLDGILSGGEMYGMEMVIVFLNAGRRGAVRGYRLLRERGFVFSGLLPGSTRGDFVVMQHFLKAPFDRKTITLEPNYDALLDEIMEINGAKDGILG